MVVLVRHVLERADLYHAGVVDEHVDAAEMLHDDFDRLPNIPTHADVAWDGEDVPAAEPLLRMPELLPVAGKQCDASALLPQFACHQEPETARASCDHDDASGIGEAIAGSSQFHDRVLHQTQNAGCAPCGPACEERKSVERLHRFTGGLETILATLFGSSVSK